MRKFTLAAMVGLLLAGPAFALTTVTYDVGIGGGPSNYWSQWKAGTYAAYTHGTSTGVQPSQVVNFDIQVTCDGTTADGYTALGLANIVFDLAVKDGGGNVVAGAKFKSLINDGSVRADIPGGARNPFEMVAFAQGWAIDGNYDGAMDRSSPTNGPGRLYDVVDSAGVNMNRVQFGSTLTHGGGRMTGQTLDTQDSYFGDCNANLVKDSTELSPATDTNSNGVLDACEGGAAILDPAKVPAGTLKGTGIGYTQFTAANPANLSAGGNVTGVGIATPFLEQVQFAYTIGLGVKPVVEGQIDMTGLPEGTYTLVLTVPTDNATPTPNKIGQNVMPGGYAFFPTAAAGGFAVKADDVIEDTATFQIPSGVTPVSIVSWKSVKTHGAAGPCAITLDPTNGKATSQPRKNGISKIEIAFSGNANNANWNPANVTVTPAPGGLTKTLSGDGLTLTIDITGAADKTCYAISLAGAASFTVGTDTNCSVADMYCNASDEATGAKSVDLGDMLNVKARIAAQQITCVKAVYDVNCDGFVDLADMLITKSKISAQGLTCP